jgi:hypothetical protein
VSESGSKAERAEVFFLDYWSIMVYHLLMKDRLVWANILISKWADVFMGDCRKSESRGDEQ